MPTVTICNLKKKKMTLGFNCDLIKCVLFNLEQLCSFEYYILFFFFCFVLFCFRMIICRRLHLCLWPNLSVKLKSTRAATCGTWSSTEARSAFLRYFQDKDHLFVPSSSVIPNKVQGTYFTNAGMNQVTWYTGLKNKSSLGLGISKEESVYVWTVPSANCAWGYLVGYK